MRCEEKSGFLMTHRCDKMAETKCAYCGKRTCVEHTRIITPNQPNAAPIAPVPGVPLNINADQLAACEACVRKQATGAGDQNVPGGLMGGRARRDPYYDDPYYSYPYYGGYHPYYYGSGFNDRDRNAFNRDAEGSGTTTDELGS